MLRTAPYLAAALIAVLGGVAHGLRTDRWSVSREVQEAAGRVARVPLKVGDWVGKDEPFDRRQLDAAGIVGYAVRRYENARLNASVGLFLVCGRPGPISVHTPDICYAGAGYVASESPARLPVTPGPGARPAEVLWADFVKQGAVAATRLRIFWAWSTGGDWRAPENPRLAHASHRALYKLYVTHESAESAGPAGPPGGGPGAAFLKDMLPELERALAPPRSEAIR